MQYSSPRRPTPLLHLTLPAVTFSMFCGAGNAAAAWRGDFESGDSSQWSYVLNDGGFSVVTDPVLEGTKSGKIAIDGTQLWSNGLNRVELQRLPDSTLGAEGSEVYFGWSLYLPEALTMDDHQIGYWESDQSYQQVMSLHARGQDLSFNTNKPGYTEHWRGAGRLTPGTWHRIVYRVFWSAAPELGKVSLWFDGELVVDQVSARTYMDNPAFIQLGILRDTIDKAEVMFLDDAREGATFAEVFDGMPSAPGSASAPSATDTGRPAPSATGTAVDIPASSSTTAPPTAPSSSASTQPPAAAASKEDSSCGFARPRSPQGALLLLLATGLLFGRSRRR